MKIFNYFIIIFFVARCNQVLAYSTLNENIENQNIIKEDHYSYIYKVFNTNQSTTQIVEFTLILPQNASLYDIQSPEGWVTNYKPGDRLIEWISSTPEKDSQPGSERDFSFSSLLAPGQSTYRLSGLKNIELINKDGLISVPINKK